MTPIKQAIEAARSYGRERISDEPAAPTRRAAAGAAFDALLSLLEDFEKHPALPSEYAAQKIHLKITGTY